jgi:hypothetical protein
MGLVAIAASSALVLGACGGGGGTTGNQQGQQGPATQGGANNSAPTNAAGSSCVNASQVFSNTQSFAGKEVTVTGTVSQVVGQHAFAVAVNTSNNNGGILGNNNSNNNGANNNGANNNGANNNAQTLLAVDKDNTTLAQGSPVEITGVLQPTFDANQAQAFTGANIDQAALTAYNGKPYVQAAFAGPISANLTNSNQGGGILNGGNNNCAAASQVLNNPQSYAGQQITVTGTVGQAVGQHAFTITANNNGGGILGNGNNNNNGNNNGANNNGNNGQTLLAVAKETTGMPTPGSPVQITGTLQPTFDMNQAAAFAGGNLDQAALNAYNGKPYIQAVFAGPVSANLANNGQGGS